MPIFFKKLNQRGIVHLIPLLLILAGIVGSVYLVQKSGFQIFKPKASSQNVEFLPGECLVSKDGKPALKCPNVNIKFTSPVDPDQRSDAGTNLGNFLSKFSFIKTAYAAGFEDGGFCSREEDKKDRIFDKSKKEVARCEKGLVCNDFGVHSGAGIAGFIAGYKGVYCNDFDNGPVIEGSSDWYCGGGGIFDFYIGEKNKMYRGTGYWLSTDPYIECKPGRECKKDGNKVFCALPGQTAPAPKKEEEKPPAAPAKVEEKPLVCERLEIQDGNKFSPVTGIVKVTPGSKTFINLVNDGQSRDSDSFQYLPSSGGWETGNFKHQGAWKAPAQAGSYKLSVKINGVDQPKCTVNFEVTAPAAPPAVNTTSCDADGRLVTKTNGTVTSTQPCPDGKICKESSKPEDRGATCVVKESQREPFACQNVVTGIQGGALSDFPAGGLEVAPNSKTYIQTVNSGSTSDSDKIEYVQDAGSWQGTATAGNARVVYAGNYTAPAQAGTYKLSVKINGVVQPKCSVNFKVTSSPATPTPTPGAGGRTGAPRCTTPTPCIYSEDDGSGVKCYSGKCSDGSATCGFNNGCEWVAGCSKQVACPAGGGESGDTAPVPAGGGTPAVAAPALRKEGITVNADCGDNPPMGAGIGERPEGYTWKSDCSIACRVNADCPVNDFDPDNVNPATSNWCYGFASGSRCLMLTKTGGLQERPARAAAPATDTRTVKTTTRFRFAEDPASLRSAQWRNYTAGGVTLPHVFKDQTLDNKPRFIYAEFEVVTKDAQGKTVKTEVMQSNPYPASITLFKEEAPAPASPANRDEPATGPIPANSDCKLYETTSVCGLGDFKTYDKCTDDKGQSGASLCSGTATQFYCEGSTNSQCISDSSRKGHYSCAACPNLKSRMGTGIPASGADDPAVPFSASCSYSPLAVSVNTPVTFTIGSTRQKVAVIWGGEASGRVVVNNGTASITRSFSTPGYKQVFATVASGEDSYTVSCEQINVSAAVSGSGTGSGGGGNTTTTTSPYNPNDYNPSDVNGEP